MRCLRFAPLLVSVFLLPGLAPAERRPLAVVEITSCNAFSASVNSIAQAINLPFIAMGVNGWLSQATSCPNLAGMDVNKPVRLVVMAPDKAEKPPAMAAVLPLADQGEILQGALRGAFKVSSREGDILSFSAAQAGGMAQEVFVSLVGDKAVTGSSREAVAEVAAALKNGTLPNVAPISGTVRATLQVPELVPMLNEMFRKQTDTLRKMGAQPGQPNPGDMMEIQMSTFLALLRQLDAFSIGLAADTAGVTLYTRTDPVPNTTLARITALQRPPDPRYRSMFPTNAIFALAGSGLDAADLFIEPYVSFMDRLYAKMGAPFSAMGPLLRQSMRDSKGLYKGDFAFAVSPAADGRGFEVVEYVAVKDELAAAKVMRSGITNAMALLKSDALAGIGFGVEMGAPRKSGPVEILPFRYTVKLDALATPAAPFLAWFGKLQGEVAVTEGHMVMVLGSTNSVARAMDRALAPLKSKSLPASPAARISPLFPEIQTVPSIEWQLASSDLLRLVLSMTGQADARKLALLPPRGDGMGGIELRQGNSLFSATRLSASELTALSKAVTAMQASSAVPAGNRAPAVTPGDGGRAPIPPHMSGDQPSR